MDGSVAAHSAPASVSLNFIQRYVQSCLVIRRGVLANNLPLQPGEAVRGALGASQSRADP
ncbi:hypothetical protein CSB93_4169 [Pseudomonas paraeruginosa]|uniref:Uncharacterized protein n=1 Tax=Pseudomonas paraeruginosa TaxID=2994495 RepID=A0A2R3IVM4_9PSED|nr:hypothetical protein CSB93_4169 [Pseudomonas paraeruginosa]AWE92189.1 hypothetical protein CSC28_2954 [Pseudomonas paraeruginosa]